MPACAGMTWSSLGVSNGRIKKRFFQVQAKIVRNARLQSKKVFLVLFLQKKNYLLN